MNPILFDLGKFGAYYQPEAHSQWHSHGFGMLATILRQNKVTCDFAQLKAMRSWQEVRQAIKGHDTLLMGLMSFDYPAARQMAKIARSIAPKIRIVAGGIHCTVAPEEVQALDVNAMILGEGEAWIVPAATNDTLTGCYYGMAADLDALPWMDRDVFAKPTEPSCGWGPAPVATMLTSRACVYKCSFCQPAERNHFGRKFRRRGVDNVIAEMRMLIERYSVKSFSFQDGLFIMQPKWLEEFIDKYAAIGLPFEASGRADLIARHPELVKGLKEVGMQVLSIGLESGSQHMLDIFEKGTTVEQNHEAIRIANDLDLTVFANVILAHPEETKEEALASVALFGEIKHCQPSVAFFAPYPGNKLGDECIAKGLSLLTPDNYTRFPSDAKCKGVDYNWYGQLMRGLNL